MARRKQSIDPFVAGGWDGGLPRAGVAPPAPRAITVLKDGACATPASAPLADLFAIDDSASDPIGAAQAKAVCGGCPVRAHCLLYAMDHEPYGIYGGKDAVERLAARGRPIPTLEERVEARRIRAMFAAGATAAQVAEHYQVCVRTIERWRKKAGLAVPRRAATSAAGSAVIPMPVVPAVSGPVDHSLSSA